MKKITGVFAFFFGISSLFSQEVFNMRTDFVPNEVDSNNVYVYFSFSYVIPKAKEETTFQKSLQREDTQKGNRLTKAEMEIVLFPFVKYEKEFHPHAFVRLDALPSSGYLSSRFGVGLSSKTLNSSAGFFHGNYYRRVPYEANLITRRKRSFENYNLSGFYVQSSSVYANFHFSMAFEKTHIFTSTRLGGRLCEILKLGEVGSRLRTAEVVMNYESLTGIGVGLSASPFDRARLEVLWVKPDAEDVYEQMRIQNKLSSGFLVSMCYFVD